MRRSRASQLLEAGCHAIMLSALKVRPANGGFCGAVEFGVNRMLDRAVEQDKNVVWEDYISVR